MPCTPARNGAGPWVGCTSAAARGVGTRTAVGRVSGGPLCPLGAPSGSLLAIGGAGTIFGFVGKSEGNGACMWKGSGGLVEPPLTNAFGACGVVLSLPLKRAASAFASAANTSDRRTSCTLSVMRWMAGTPWACCVAFARSTSYASLPKRKTATELRSQHVLMAAVPSSPSPKRPRRSRCACSAPQRPLDACIHGRSAKPSATPCMR